MKYKSCREYAVLFGRMLADEVLASGLHIETVTYIPTDSKRVRQRGFDHAELMAKSCAVQLKLPCVPTLRRMRHARQVGATQQMRKEQMATMFRVSADSMHGQKVLLVDDVISTGATLEAAAKCLRKEAGAQRVVVAVVAHNK